MGFGNIIGTAGSGTSGVSLELAASNSTTALGAVKTTIVTYTSSGSSSIALAIGTTNIHGRFFLVHNSSDIDERVTAENKTVLFNFGSGLYHLDDGDTLDVKFESPTGTTLTANVNATIYKSI